MDGKKHLSGAQKRKRKKSRNEDFKRMKGFLANWVLSYNKQYIADSSDREEKT